MMLSSKFWYFICRSPLSCTLIAFSTHIHSTSISHNYSEYLHYDECALVGVHISFVISIKHFKAHTEIERKICLSIFSLWCCDASLCWCKCKIIKLMFQHRTCWTECIFAVFRWNLHWCRTLSMSAASALENQNKINIYSKRDQAAVIGSEMGS